MYELTTFWDPFLGRQVKWSTWRPGPAEVVQTYVDKHTAYRPLQQRARDGTVVRHKKDGIARQSSQR
jgi:hypothetical protein